MREDNNAEHPTGSPLGRSQPNIGLEPTRNSLRSCLAPALARGSGLALGCAETNRHDVKEWKSPTVKVEPTTLAPSPARASVTGSVKR